MSKKFKIYVDETQLFTHTIEVTAESFEVLDKVASKLERKGVHPDDIRYILNEDGVQILNFNRDDSGICSFEVPDIEEIE